MHMGAAKKGRRQITVLQKEYLWYVAPDDDSAYEMLHIVSQDKSLILSCPLKTETAYAISKGRIFQNKQTDGTWNRYLLPFPVPETVTPRVVLNVIVWAVNGETAEAITWNGKDVPV